VELGALSALFPLVTGVLVTIIARQRWRQLRGTPAPGASIV
jgi:hypothetical protein